MKETEKKMTGNHSCRFRWRRVIELVFGITLLACGCAIYLLFRSKSIRLYQWFEAAGFSDVLVAARNVTANISLPDIIVYSLPDGLYCAAYILTMDAVWMYEHCGKRFVIVCFVPVMALIHEMLQGLRLAEGTFDWADFTFYAIPLILYFTFSKETFFTKPKLNLQ